MDLMVKSFFFNEGFYDIKNATIKYYPDTFSNCIYQPVIDSVFAIHNSEKLVSYDYKNNTFHDLGIKNDSWFKYYGTKEYIYYTRNRRRNPIQALFRIFAFGGQPVSWYRFSLKTKENILIFSPGDFSSVIGSIN